METVSEDKISYPNTQIKLSSADYIVCEDKSIIL